MTKLTPLKRRTLRLGIVCSNCSHAISRVTQTFRTSFSITRRRQCDVCGTRFWTTEIRQADIPPDPAFDKLFGPRRRKFPRRRAANRTTARSEKKALTPPSESVT